MELTKDMVNLTSEIMPERIEGSIKKAFTLLRTQMIKEVDNRCGGCRRQCPSRDLRVHHLDGCALNWARNNLIIVCKDCHHIFHGHTLKPKCKEPTIESLQQSYLEAHPRELSGTKTERFERWRKALTDVRSAVATPKKYCLGVPNDAE